MNIITMNITMTNIQLINSLIAAIFVGGIGGYLGSLMITKRMSLAGDALGHLALPGVAIAILYNLNLTYGALISLVVGITIVWFLESKTKLATDALTGIVFTTSTAAAFLFLQEEDLETALVGNIATVSRTEAIISAISLTIVFILIRWIYNEIILANLSDDIAKVQKINVRRNDFVYLFSIAVLVALGIKIVGSLLIGALVIIPAATAKNVSKSMNQYAYGGIIFGILSSIAGILLASALELPAGPIIILVSTMFFVLSVLVKK